MNKILSYDEFKVNESFPKAYHDPSYGSDVFRIRYRQNNDLSNKKGSDLLPKPINDLLDTYQIGDIVRGKSISDGSYYDGKVMNIVKDEDGENVEIEIENDGEMILLAPATVTMLDDTGNRKQSVSVVDQEQLDQTQGSSYQNTTYESINNKSNA